MKGQDLQIRTKSFAIRVIRFVKFLNGNTVGRVLANQILRSGTSVAANYRAACRAKSSKDFINKIAIVIEEADETMFWLELMKESGLVKENFIQDLYNEANELTAIMVASRKSASYNLRSNKFYS